MNIEQIKENENFAALKSKNEKMAQLIAAAGTTDEILEFLSREENINEFECLITRNITEIGYYHLMKEYAGVYGNVIADACEKNIPATIMQEWLSSAPEEFEIAEKINNYKSIIPGSTAEQYVEEDEDIHTYEPAPGDDEPEIEIKANEISKPDIGVQSPTVSEQKNEITKTLEDLLGEPDRIMEEEEADANLEDIVSKLTKFISNDKRKTDLINNLRRIIAVSNRHIDRMENKIREMEKYEKTLKDKNKRLESEKDDYKNKYESLNKKVKSLMGDLG